ncbi:glycosyltransferase [Lentzea sp. NPDC051208]|uniref:glycosyltransferase n=1 Tax=Lentzea sp. NPDC051208 TaxID=3154642 RepID=UPI00341BC162
MRIALVTSHTGTTALETAVAGLARALARSGHDAVVHTRRDAAHLAEREHTPDGYEVVRVALGPARPMSADAAWSYTNELARFLNREWDKRPPDIAHTYGTMAGLAALLAAREHKIPVVHTHNEPDPERERVERLVCRHAAHVVAPSNGRVTGLCRMGIPRSRITVVPAGVDLDGQETAGTAARRPGRVSLLGIGELRSGHGFDTVVAAMAEVRDARLVIAAPVETLDRKTGQEAKRLRQFAVRLGVADRVSVAGTATPSDVAALLRSADVVVTTPRQDSSGVYALEAMGHGLPVVASAVGALADAVVDGVTGRLVPPGDVPALALSLREMVAEPAKREAFGTAGADRVRARYGWDRVAADTLLVYQRVEFVSA